MAPDGSIIQPDARDQTSMNGGTTHVEHDSNRGQACGDPRRIGRCMVVFRRMRATAPAGRVGVRKTVGAYEKEPNARRSRSNARERKSRARQNKSASC